MNHLQATLKSRSQKTAVAWNEPRGTHHLSFKAALAACCVLTTASLRADTIFLKDGNQILDCKVTSETETSVSLRTPAGDMVVPRTAIYRIQKQKSAYDNYSEQLSRIREGDVNGLFKLAQWCRTANSLRKESDELLAKVISLKENHAEARRLLGHVRVDDKWIVPAPLSIRLQIAGADEKHAIALRDRLGLFLQSRQDVRLSSEPDGGNPLNHCTLNATVVVSRQAASKFYGQTFGRPSFAASVGLRAESPWIGKTMLKVAVDGQVPESANDGVLLAIQNALGGNSTSLHQFLDRVTQLRAKMLEKELGKEEPKKEKENG